MVSIIKTYSPWDLCYSRRRDPVPMRCTLGHVRDMCRMLENTLAGYSFRPEPIKEGGIEFTDWPNKRDGEYKTFRFITSQGFPFLSNDTSDEEAFALSNHSQRITIFLKAFHGAPAFTDDELCAFRHVFGEVVKPADGWHMYTNTPPATTFEY